MRTTSPINKVFNINNQLKKFIVMKRNIVKMFVCLLVVCECALIFGTSYSWANSLSETACLWANGKIAGYIMLAVWDVIICGFASIPVVIMNSEK